MINDRLYAAMEEAARHPTIPPLMQAAQDDYNRYTSLRAAVRPAEPPLPDTQIVLAEPTEPPAAPTAPTPQLDVGFELVIRWLGRLRARLRVYPRAGRTQRVAVGSLGPMTAYVPRHLETHMGRHYQRGDDYL